MVDSSHIRREDSQEEEDLDFSRIRQEVRRDGQGNQEERVEEERGPGADATHVAVHTSRTSARMALPKGRFESSHPFKK